MGIGVQKESNVFLNQFLQFINIKIQNNSIKIKTNLIILKWPFLVSLIEFSIKIKNNKVIPYNKFHHKINYFLRNHNWIHYGTKFWLLWKTNKNLT